MRSLRTRVVLSAALVLTVFILLTSLALEQAFRDSARSAREERLLGQLYLLMAAAEAEDGSLRLPEELAEPRFSLPESGLYATVLNAAGERVWESPSNFGLYVPFGQPIPPGERAFDEATDTDGNSYFVDRFGVSWATGPRPLPYTFAVAEDLEPYRKELRRFRNSLASWLAVMSVLMLLALLLSMRWGLAPLRRVADELARIESGSRERIVGEYPSELRALTDNLNALLAHERAQQKRLGNALGDLAHSLKTPLSVMRGALDPTRIDPAVICLLQEQIGRMDYIVAYQLQRARSRAGASARLAPRVAVAVIAERLGDSLAKVYRDKDVSLELAIDRNLTFRGSEGDLMELLGNLMDNAYKWSAGRVRVYAAPNGSRVLIGVGDDGPGIPPEQAELVIGRGARADQTAPGHGIGLAIVQDICEAYGGTLAIGRSNLGGAAVEVTLER